MILQLSFIVKRTQTQLRITCLSHRSCSGLDSTTRLYPDTIAATPLPLSFVLPAGDRETRGGLTLSLAVCCGDGYSASYVVVAPPKATPYVRWPAHREARYADQQPQQSQLPPLNSGEACSSSVHKYRYVTAPY